MYFFFIIHIAEHVNVSKEYMIELVVVPFQTCRRNMVFKVMIYEFLYTVPLQCSTALYLQNKQLNLIPNNVPLILPPPPAFWVFI